MRKLSLVTSFILAILLVSSVVAMAGNAYGHDKKALTGSFSIGMGSTLGSAAFVPDAQAWTSDSWQDTSGKWHDEYYYDVTSPVELTDTTTGNVIGYIDTLQITIDEDPAVSVQFSCRAGAADTTFNFSNYLNTALTNPDAQATAAVTATDRRNDGVTLTGLYGPKCYRATYNTSSIYADLVDGGTAGNGLSYSDNESYGWTTVSGSVSRMDAAFQFKLSAFDAASGTSNYQMIETTVPEPSGILAIGTGLSALLGLISRRRRA